jgi:hypothetical protein
MSIFSTTFILYHSHKVSQISQSIKLTVEYIDIFTNLLHNSPLR